MFLSLPHHILEKPTADSPLILVFLSHSGPATVLIAGGCAGTVSWVLATPMDVVKARLQMDGLKGVTYHGILDCVLTSARQEGPRVFLKGMALNCLRAFPVNAATFLGYESILKVIG